MPFQTLTTPDTTLEKAYGGPPTKGPKFGYWNGLAVIAIGKKGGKIVGWGKGGKPIYAGTQAAAKLAALKKTAALKGKPTTTSVLSGHVDDVKAWLAELGVAATFGPAGGSAGQIAMSPASLKLFKDSFGVGGKVMGSAHALISVEELWPHVGEALKPSGTELPVFQAKHAAGGEDVFPDAVLSSLQTVKSLGGSHGGLVVKDSKGNLYAWKPNQGDVKISRAEEAANRIARLIFPKPELYAQGEVVTHDGAAGVLLTWLPGSTLGAESSGHGVPLDRLQKHFPRLVQHQVVDWLISNHDSHGANFHVTPDGDLAALDKGQAWKAIGNDQLSTTYKLNASAPAYNQMWAAFQAGKIKGDPVKAAAKVLDNIAKLSEEQLHSIMLPYLETLGPSSAKHVWNAALARFQNIRSDFEKFYSKILGKPVKFPEPPLPALEQPDAPAPTSPAVAVAPPTLQQVPGWPSTKGNVTVHHPGGAVPIGAKWKSGYPGPGAKVTVEYKGKPYDFAFSVVAGKMHVDVAFPGGQVLGAGSPQNAADLVVMHAKGQTPDLKLVDKKKPTYSATKLLKLKDFADDFAQSNAIPVSPAAKPVQELEKEKLVEPTDEKVSVFKLASAMPDGIVMDTAALPVEVQDYVAAYGQGPHPEGLPPPGTVLKATEDDGVHFYTYRVTKAGAVLWHDFWMNESAGHVDDVTIPLEDETKYVVPLFALPDVAATLKPKKAPPPAVTPPEPKATYAGWNDYKPIVAKQMLDDLAPGTLIESEDGQQYIKLPDGKWKAPELPQAPAWPSAGFAGNGLISYKVVALGEPVDVMGDAIALQPKKPLDIPEEAPKAVPLEQTSAKVVVPDTAPKFFEGPLPAGASITKTVKKKGLGEVTLKVIAKDHVEVHLGPDDVSTFSSLSAASDHVWVKSQGYDSIEQYKEKNKTNKVPSGGGWKFWGISTAEGKKALEGAPATAPVSGTSGSLVPGDVKVTTQAQLDALPVGAVVGEKNVTGADNPDGDVTWTKLANGKWQVSTGSKKEVDAAAVADLGAGSADGDWPVVVYEPEGAVAAAPEGHTATYESELAALPAGTEISLDGNGDDKHTKLANGKWLRTKTKKLHASSDIALTDGTPWFVDKLGDGVGALHLSDLADFPVGTQIQQDGHVWTKTKASFDPTEDQWTDDADGDTAPSDAFVLQQLKVAPKSVKLVTQKITVDEDGLNDAPFGTVIYFGDGTLLTKHPEGWVDADSGSTYSGYEVAEHLQPSPHYGGIADYNEPGKQTTMSMGSGKLLAWSGAKDLTPDELEGLPIGTKLKLEDGYGGIYTQTTAGWVGPSGTPWELNELSYEGKFSLVDDNLAPSVGDIITTVSHPVVVTDVAQLHALPVGSTIASFQKDEELTTYTKTPSGWVYGEDNEEITPDLIVKLANNKGLVAGGLTLQVTQVGDATNTSPGPAVNLSKEALAAMPVGTVVTVTTASDTMWLKKVHTKQDDGFWKVATTYKDGSVLTSDDATDLVLAVGLAASTAQGFAVDVDAPTTHGVSHPTPSALVWDGMQKVGVTELAKLPPGTLLENHIGTKFKKAIDGTWEGYGGAAYSADEVAGDAAELGILTQPGAPGWGVPKIPSALDLDSLPVGTQLSSGFETYWKSDTGTWEQTAGYSKGAVFTASTLAHDLADTQTEVSVAKLGLGAVVASPSPPPAAPTPSESSVQPTGVPAPKSFSGKAGPQLVPPSAVPHAAGLTITDGGLEWGQQPSSAAGKTVGMKSPKWPDWVPPIGTWIAAEHNGQKLWLATVSQGYPVEGSLSDEPFTGVGFAVVTEHGASKGKVLDKHGSALTNALKAAGVKLTAKEAQKLFGLDVAHFPADMTTAQALKLAPPVESVVTENVQDIDPAIKGDTVSTTMTIADLLKTKALEEKYGGTFSLTPYGDSLGIPNASVLKLNTGGASWAAKKPLQQFLDDYGIPDLNGNGPQGVLGGAVVVISNAALDWPVATEATVIEAASATPIGEQPDYVPWPPHDFVGIHVESGMYASAPVGAKVKYSGGTVFQKLADGSWQSNVSGNKLPSTQMEASLAPGQPVYEPPTDQPWWGDGYAPVEKAHLVTAPVGQVLHTLSASGNPLKLVKTGHSLWTDPVGGAVYGAAQVATFETFVVEPPGVAGKGAPAVVIQPHLKLSQIDDKLTACAKGTTLTLSNGWTLTKGAGAVWDFKSPAGLVNATSQMQAASLIKSTGGVGVTPPGPGVTPKMKPAPKPKPAKPAKTKEQLAAEAKAKAELEAKVAKAKEYSAWLKDHPPATSSLGKELAQFKANAFHEPAYAHVVGGSYLMLGAPDFQKLKEAVDNFEGFPPYVVKDTPLGQMLQVQQAKFKKAFPKPGTVKGPDGKTYPEGTEFQKKEKANTKQFLLEQQAGFSKFSVWKGPNPNDELIAAKFSNSNTEEDVLAKLKAAGLEPHDGKVMSGPQYKTAGVKKAALLEKLVEVTWEAKEPEATPPFVAAAAPFSIGPQKEGEPAIANRADLAAMDVIKPGPWGHVIRMGQPGVIRDMQVRVRKVKNPKGEDYYEVIGEMLSFNAAKSKLSSGSIPVHFTDGTDHPYDSTTGMHKLPHQTEMWSAHKGTTEGGSLVGVIDEAHFAAQNTLVCRIPVSKNLEEELAECFDLVQPGSAATAMAEHDATAERMLIKSQVVRAVLGNKGYLKYDANNKPLKREKYADEAWLDEQLKTLGVSHLVDTAKVVVDAGGAHSVILDDFDPQGNGKHVEYLSTGTHGLDHVVNNLLHEAGMPSRVTGYLKVGTDATGASESADMSSGGALAAFTRIMTKAMGDTAYSGTGYGSVRYVFHPRVLKRADCWTQLGDTFGSLTQNLTLAGVNQRDYALKKTHAAGNETLFEHGVAHKDIVGISCTDEATRKSCLAKWKQKGGGPTIHGVPVEEFFFVAPLHSKKAILAKCKLLKDPP